MPVAAVIGHDVEHIAHVARIQRPPQRDEGRVAAKVGIDMIVVGHVILVVRQGRENRIQVEGIDAQVGQIAQARLDAGQVAAVKDQREELIGRWRRTPRVGGRAMAAVFVLLRPRVGGGIAIGEAVGEDLVEDRFHWPARWIIVGQNAEVGVVERDVGRRAGRAVVPQAVGRLDDEAVVSQRLVEEQVCLPPLAGRFGRACLHGRQRLLAVGETAQQDAAHGSVLGDAQP